MVHLLFNVLHVSGVKSLQFFFPGKVSFHSSQRFFFGLTLLLLIEIQSRFHGEVAQTIPTLCQLYTTFPWPNHFNIFFWKALDLYFECPPIFGLYLLLLIGLVSQTHHSICKISKISKNLKIFKKKSRKFKSSFLNVFLTKSLQFFFVNKVLNSSLHPC